MPSLIETAIYALTAVIVFAVVGSIYVLATTEAAESEDTEPYGEANTYRRERL